MEQKSIWLDNVSSQNQESLKQNITCNTLIIGGGIAGINIAYHLKDEPNTVLIDKDKIGYGVTSHTTGKLTYLQGTMYTDIEKAHNFNIASRYLQSQKDAIELALKIIKENNINCDLEKNDSYLFTTEENDNLNNQKDFFAKNNIKYEETKLPIEIPNHKAIKVKDTYVFHPIKYILKLKEIIKNKIQIYENTTAIDVDMQDNQYIVKTKNGNTIKTKNLVIATHYPFFVIPGLLPVKLELKQSYAMSATHKNEKFNAINIDKETYSIRFYKDNIIVGGFSHDLSDNLDYKKEQDKLLNYYSNHFKEKINNVWLTHDITSHDYLPIMSRLNKNHPNLFIVTAFNKWGMANGILSGKIISDLIKNKENKYETLFQIDRPLSLEKAKNFIISNAKIGKTYIGTKLNKNKEFYNQTYIENIDGTPYAVYIDEKGNKHKVRNTCPHFKCTLIFNNAEKTWDCPCHGSRFDIDGNLIEGPSVFDIKIKDQKE